jgi:phenylpropionate dioxygenase-like ring-hydroxylating dioxygenase large terminal subunit
MGLWEHWHPVARSVDVRGQPVEVQLGGVPIVVFRTTGGQVGALSNICPHRRFKLSAGEVVGDRLRCRYHGWTFNAEGQGESPATPKLHTCIDSYDTREAYGLVWLKSRQAAAVFPTIDAEGFYPIGTFVHDAPAPLELTVDNFNEIEHSGTVHRTFGYDLDRLHEVTVEYQATEDSVTVRNRGPTKRIFWLYALWLGLRRGDLFHDHWTTRFSPVHSVFDHWWTDATGNRERMVRWRVYVFYVPWDEQRTRLFSIGFARSRYPGPHGGLRLIRWLFRRELDREIRSDVAILHDLASYDTSIAGLKLGRFDKVLGLTRERIERIYRRKGTLPNCSSLVPNVGMEKKMTST